MPKVSMRGLSALRILWTRVSVALTTVYLALAISGCSQETEIIRGDLSPQTDFVLINGNIFTSNSASPSAEAIVVRNGIFEYVGDNAAALAHEPNLQVMDASGRKVLPGLIRTPITLPLDGHPFLDYHLTNVATILTHMDNLTG